MLKTDILCRNDFVSVEYIPSKDEIFAYDLTDQDEPAFYTKPSLKLQLVWNDIKSSFKENTHLWELIVICTNNGVKVHFWYMQEMEIER